MMVNKEPILFCVGFTSTPYIHSQAPSKESASIYYICILPIPQATQKYKE